VRHLHELDLARFDACGEGVEKACQPGGSPWAAAGCRASAASQSAQARSGTHRQRLTERQVSAEDTTGSQRHAPAVDGCNISGS
jgi:hypothetical protein